MQRTIRRLVERGILAVKLDEPKPMHDRPVKVRKPTEQRAKVGAGRPLQSSNEWPKGRKLRSPGFDKRGTN